MSQINWNKEYVKYIRYLQQSKKFRGFSYPCLATQKDIRKRFQYLKRKYLRRYHKEQKTKKKRFSQSAGGYDFSTAVMGLTSPASSLPYLNQLPNTKLY